MTYGTARILFDAMDTDHKNSVVRIFDLIRAEHGTKSVFNCFSQAVESEAREIEREMLFERETAGTA